MGYKLNSMILVLATVLVAGQAAADVIVTSRYSKIEALGAVNNEWVESDSYDHLDETASYGVFGSAFSDVAEVTNHSIASAATQASELTVVGGFLQEASADGDTIASRSDGTGIPAGGGYGFGISLFVIDFDVSDVPAPYHLLGAISSHGTLDTFAEVKLANMDTLTAIESWRVDGENIVGFDVSGLLSPGSYQLYVVAHSDSPGPFSNSADYDVTLTVPEPSAFAMLSVTGIGLGGLIWRRRSVA